MAMHPEVQVKAQEELDNYLSLTRLPDLEDRDYLPYCQAIFMEVLRWRPAVPLGLPHRLMVDDQYEEYHLPAGAMIVPVSTLYTYTNDILPMISAERLVCTRWVQ